MIKNANQLYYRSVSISFLPQSFLKNYFIVLSNLHKCMFCGCMFKVIKMLIIVVALFTLCWLPLQTYNILQHIFPQINE